MNAARSSTTTRAALIGGLIVASVLVAAAWLAQPRGDQPARPTPLRPAPTAEPLVPTALPAFVATAAPRADPAGTDPASAEDAPRPQLEAPGPGNGFPFGGSARRRIGAGFPIGTVRDYEWGGGRPGWWLAWRADPDVAQARSSRFVQMVRFREDGHWPALDEIQSIARAAPGSLWLMGNEPDVAWQDNITAEQYATTYRKLYAAIKAADPTAQVAIGGVSQPTPLRLEYLDNILAAYRTQSGEEMPVDVWNVHAFVLREEEGSWGVGIPPGMTEEQGRLYEIDDHADMEIFKQQIVDFRRWMADRGFRDKPLVVSEYGILMPDSYGFPPDVVAGFLADTFDFFLVAADPEIGYPQDANRLVQAFCWYSAADTVYPTSNLFDPETKTITPVGEMFTAYVAGLPDEE